MNKHINVILTKVYFSDKSKNGKPLRDKNGKPYKKVGIKTDVHGDKWLSALSFEDTDGLRELEEGQSVEIVVEQRGDFLNFSLPSRADLLENRIEQLEAIVFGRGNKPSVSVPMTDLEEPMDDMPIQPKRDKEI